MEGGAEEAELELRRERWLAAYCFLTLAVVLVLLYAGGFTTTIGAGMVFADWPLSNGSLNPPGWIVDEAMRAEHGHRLLGALTGTLCIGLAVSMWRVERRAWLRRLSYAALALVVVQGLLGGARVLLVNVDLAKVHGVLAQVFLCVLTAVAVGASRWWARVRGPATAAEAAIWRRLRLAGLAVCLLTMVQLVVGAVLRHRGAGLAIPYFPHGAPDGGLLPLSWNWATTLAFSHRALALVIYLLVTGWVAVLAGSRLAAPAVRKLALAALVLVNVQVALGASILWSARLPVPTTLHVLNGAVFLSVCWAVTFSFYKPVLEKETQPCRTAY